VNPLQKLASWWRGPTDAETLASEAENERGRELRDTIRASQNPTARQGGGSLLSAPTPDVLEPGREDRHKPR
jgi:hypothetical protein